MAFFNRRRIAVIAGVAAVFMAQEARAQSPAFEAASIRRNRSGEANTHIDLSGGRLTITNASLKTLIRNAYDLLSFQLAGEPHWIDTEMYDIVATTGRAAKIQPDEFRLLLQNLLADRFQLRVHWETREAAVYALVPEKGGPKLQESTTPQEPGINTSKGPGRARMLGTREPIAILTKNLGNQLGRIVLDKTGLQGVYDWTLEWDPDPGADATRPSLFTALQEQLGLRLEAQRAPMEVLVIDHADHASEN